MCTLIRMTGSGEGCGLFKDEIVERKLAWPDG